MVTVKAKQTFAHGPHYPRKGEKIEVSEATAADLQKAGLIEPVAGEKQAPAPENKMAAIPANKAAAKPKAK